MRDIVKLKDTIVSAATFPANSAVGIVKISGKKAIAIASEIFRPKNKKDLKKVPNFTLHYGWIVNSATTKKSKEETIIDEVLVAVMRAPNSYTKEDVIEIHSHSGHFLLSKIIDLCVKHGARQADPGEFTKRAFLNGRIDLVRAEAVQDVIDAVGDESLRMSMSQLCGKLSSEFESLYSILDNACMQLEADISFPEDVYADFDIVKSDLKKASEKISNLLRYSEKAQKIRDGVRCVICGSPNAGKSSLLNMILEEERVIVTHIAGTTRDVVEEKINIKGMPFRFFDTAGILNPRDEIEQKAIDKSFKTIEDADLILFVLDISAKISKEDKKLLETIKGRNVLVVLNKSDLKEKYEKEYLEKFKFPEIKVSAKNHSGLSELENALFKTAGCGVLPKDQNVFVSNKRHIALLQQASENINYAKESITTISDLAFFKTKNARENIAEILGKNLSSDFLDDIFSSFCIGK